MQYDPIKHSLGAAFNKTPLLRILFYKLLDLLLLRTWHVKKTIRHWYRASSIEQPASSIQDPASLSLREAERRSKSILDAGSGFGQYTYFLSGLGKNLQVDAVDVKEDQIADCTQFFSHIGRKNVSFTTADLTTFKKPDTYDLILSVDVMEHILEDELVFRNFYESLKPGGMVLISTPSDQGGSEVHNHDHDSSFIDEHVRDGYGVTGIQEKLKRAGFHEVEAHYTYGKPGQIGWKLSMKYPILMLNASKIFFLLLPFYYLLTYPVSLLCNGLDLWLKHKTGTGLIVKAWK